MVEIVYTERELNAAFDKNTDDIELGQDIIINNFYERSFSHVLDGKNYALNFKISNNDEYQYWLSLSGTIKNVRINGHITWTYDESASEECGFLILDNTRSIPQLHHILFEKFTISNNVPFQQTYYSVISHSYDAKNRPSAIHDIQFKDCNFNIQDLQATELFYLNKQSQIERISFDATSESIYHFIFPNLNVKNAYAYGIAVIDTRTEQKTVPTGHGYGAHNSSSGLIFNSNCQFEGGILHESSGNGSINDNPNFIAMGFNATNGWEVIDNNQIRLSQFFEKSIDIEGTNIVKIGDTARYTAVLRDVKGIVQWTVDDITTTGETFDYIPESTGNKTITASCVDEDDKRTYKKSIDVNVVDLKIHGKEYANVGDTIHYTAEPIGFFGEITWKINDELYQVSDEIDVTFDTEGKQKITASIGDISTDFITHVGSFFIELDNVIKVDTIAKFVAKHEDEIIDVIWNFDGEETIEGGAVTYIWKTTGIKNITATYKGATVTVQQEVLDIRFEGSEFFANQKEHKLTAIATADGGTYLWDDGIEGQTHIKTYQGYYDGNKVLLGVTYTYKDVKIHASFEIMCYDSAIFLESNKYNVKLNDSINLTSYQDGLEIPIAEKLYHKETSGEWEELVYSSLYKYTFNDTIGKTHNFKYSVEYEIQGLKEITINVKTYDRYIKIIEPDNMSKVFVNFPVTFKVEAYNIDNPSFVWSTKDIGEKMEYIFTESGNQRIDVKCETEEKTYDASVNLVVWEQDELNITIPDKFYENKPIYFKAESNLKHPFSIIWNFNEEEQITEKEGTYTFKNQYKDGEKVNVNVIATFTDDLGNTFSRNIRYELICVIPEVSIVKPSRNINIFANIPVDFACETKHITNPSYEWSTGERTKEFKHAFTEGKQEITVTCIGDEGTFTDTITIYIIRYPILEIEKPEYFINKVPIKFKDRSYFHPSILSWEFSDGTIDYGLDITKIFDNFKDDELVTCDVNATFTDEGGNTIQTDITFSVKCVTPKITITSPKKDINIYEGFEIPFDVEIEYITNPRFTWSTGETTQAFTHIFKFGDSGQITVNCECDESEYTGEFYQDTININIMDADKINITAPKSDKFVNNTPIRFTVEAKRDFNVVWFFPDEIEYYEKTFQHTFSGYEMGQAVIINVIARFTDDLGNILTREKSITLYCIEPSVSIIRPIDNSRIYKDFNVTFEAGINHITNPHFSWSIGNKNEQIITHKFNIEGTYEVTVTCEGDEGIFTNSITIYVMNRDDINIIAPSIFQNDIPVKFIAEYNHPCLTSWEFPDGEYDTGYEVEHTFMNYKHGDVITVTLYATFEDDLGNTFTTEKSIELLCSEFLYSFYENSKGKRFYFDKSCKILQTGISGISEIQLATTTFNTQQYNVVNGIDCASKQIIFNILIPSEGKRDTPEDIQRILTQIHTKKRELTHELTPTKELGTFYYLRDDGQMFSIRCNIALGYPIFTDESLKDGWFGTVSFIAPDGYWEGKEITEKADKINNLGDISCGFKAKLTGNLENTTNGTGIYALTEKTLNGYQINTSTGLIIDNNGNNGWKDVTVNSTLVKLEIGKNVITGCKEVTYKPRYLGV